jgi:hypothetical protein
MFWGIFYLLEARSGIRLLGVVLHLFKAVIEDPFALQVISFENGLCAHDGLTL